MPAQTDKTKVFVGRTSRKGRGTIILCHVNHHRSTAACFQLMVSLFVVSFFFFPFIDINITSFVTTIIVTVCVHGTWVSQLTVPERDAQVSSCCDTRGTSVTVHALPRHFSQKVRIHLPLPLVHKSKYSPSELTISCLWWLPLYSSRFYQNKPFDHLEGISRRPFLFVKPFILESALLQIERYV